MPDHESPNGRFCLSDPPPPTRPDRPRCKGYDYAANTPALVEPRDTFCEQCSQAYERDIRALLWDWLDLEQLQVPSLSQALDTQPAGRPGPPMPLAGAPEALQAEIHHVLTTWETEVRIAARLSDPPESRYRQAAPWHTTVTNRPPKVKPRPGEAVQRATHLLAARLNLLAGLPATAVFATGCEDHPEDVAGWEAVLHLSDLHRRARSLLGRTRRVFWVPGECWETTCAAEHDKAVKAGKAQRGEWLYRSEPSYYRQETVVICRYCSGSRSLDSYDRYVKMLVWPAQQLAEQAAA